MWANWQPSSSSAKSADRAAEICEMPADRADERPPATIRSDQGDEAREPALNRSVLTNAASAEKVRP
jgi:hypothetical protein